MRQNGDDVRPETWLVAAGRPTAPGEPLNTPMVPASNFALDGSRCYSREDATPGWEALETLVGGLEGGSAVAFASGMAAVSAVFHGLPTGAHIVLPDDCYQAVAAIAADGARLGRWEVERLPGGDTGAWCDACGRADLLWLESPSNPQLVVADLATVCAVPRRRPGAILAVDNTFATPLNQQPLRLGADISIQSATKFIGGHSDLLAGIATARDASLLERLRRARTVLGATPGTLEAFLALRGARTLALRLERAQCSAGEIAARLAAHPEVETVRYPGLATHPGHEIARRQLRGFGTIVSFDVRGGAAAADRVCRTLRLVRHATSLGAVESTIERRAALAGQEHLPPGLLRLSVGIEHVDDIWADITAALAGGAGA
jgi:cystathionine gamma-synthase